MDFTPELNLMIPISLYLHSANHAVFAIQYEFDPEGLNSRSNCDIPVYRLGLCIVCVQKRIYAKTDMSLADVNSLRTSRTREAAIQCSGNHLLLLNANALQ